MILYNAQSPKVVVKRDLHNVKVDHTNWEIEAANFKVGSSKEKESR